jgi:hypothetical protein
MALKMRRLAVLAKIETTYGTDSVPTGGANAILLQDVTVTPMETDQIPRTLIRAFLGAEPVVLAAKRMRIQATVDLAGSGTAGTAPAYGPLLRACGMAEVITAGTRVEYTPVSSGEESVSIYANLDGILHKGLGARGTFSINLVTKDFSKLVFDFTGFFITPTGAALPTADYSAWKEPRPVGFADTPVFTLDGYAAPMSGLTYAHTNTVSFRDLVNRQAIEITDRKPVANVTIEAPPIATKDFFAVANNQVPVALACTQGVGAGKIIALSLPSVQVLNPAYQNDEGSAMLAMELRPLPVAGNDEIEITVR